jgi:hypothetical protein
MRDRSELRVADDPTRTGDPLRIFANEVVHIDGRGGVDGGSAESLIADLASLRYFSMENQIAEGTERIYVVA